MFHIRTYTETEECRHIWERLWPDDCFFDLWPVRSCFNQAFNRPLHFQVFEQDNVPKGMIALCWIKEQESYGHFPGETWKGETWLEQNKIISSTADMSMALIDSLPGTVHLRYLTHDSFFQTRGAIHQDEIGYLFLPQKYGYSFDQYRGEFSGKTRKKMNAEMAKLERQTVTIRHNRLSDVDLLFKMNIQAFEKDSYFSDQRFLTAFERLVSYMTNNDMIRVTTVLIGGKTAAVDVGALYKGTYTILAGGTSPEFKGIAKLINFHHIEWACKQKIKMVDFLCGNFNWKERFHLTPRPLYALKRDNTAHCRNLYEKTKEIKICA